MFILCKKRFDRLSIFFSYEFSCALEENDYLDDGTYTAIKVIGLLAREKSSIPNVSLFDLISALQELQVSRELCLPLKGGKMESLERVFYIVVSRIEERCDNANGWYIDEDNLEGVRVSTGDDGGFFMLRKSLHDPVLSLHIEAACMEDANARVIEPILSIFRGEEEVLCALDLSALK
jgi:phosphomannomutase